MENLTDEEVRVYYEQFRLMAHSFYGKQTKLNEKAYKLYIKYRNELLKRKMERG